MAREKKIIRVDLSTSQSQVQGERARRTVQELRLQAETVASIVHVSANGVHLLPDCAHLPRERKGSKL